MACFSNAFSSSYRRCNLGIAVTQTGRQSIRGKPKMVYYAGAWIPVSTVTGDDVSLRQDQLHVGNAIFNPMSITVQFQQEVDTMVLPSILGPAAQV